MPRRKHRRLKCRYCGKKYGRRTSTPAGYCSKACRMGHLVQRQLQRDRANRIVVGFPKRHYQ